MPLYEYECEHCGARFEVIQRFSDAAIETCQKCGGPVHKLISSPAIHFKGTGWYITDYAKKDGGSPSTPSSPAPSGTDTKSESSSSSATTTSSGSSSSTESAKKDKG